MSNMQQSSMTTKKLVTDMVEFNTGDIVSKIDSESLSTNPHALPNSKLISRLIGGLQEHLDKIDPDNLAFKDKAVITDPTVSPIFDEEKIWDMEGFTLYDHLITYTGAKELHGNLYLPNVAYSEAGYYLLKIIIDELIDGQLTLVDSGDKSLIHFNEAGVYYFEIKVTHPLTDEFYLSTTRHTVNTRIKIPYLGIHFIKDHFHAYITDKIRAIAEIDGGGYLSLDQFHMFMELRDAIRDEEDERIRIALTGHTLSTNPHKITPSLIGASSVDHMHHYSDVGAAAKDHGHTPTELGVSPADHTHEGLYHTSTAIESMIQTALKSREAMVSIVAPMTIVDGPLGILPDKYMDGNVHPQVQLLVPGLLYHDADTEFDTQSGMVSKSGHPNDTLKYLFSLTADAYTVFDDTETEVSLHYQFHTQRTLVGYEIHCDVTTGRPVDWDVYGDFDNYIHHGTIPPEVEGSVFTFTFMEPVVCDTITWTVVNVDMGTEYAEWAMRIKPIFGDVQPDTINITREPFVLSVPDNGSNKTCHVLPTQTALQVCPSTHIENIPLYVYLDVDAESNVTVGSTYFPPNVGMIRKGTIMLWNYAKYFTWNDTTKKHEHPFLGTYYTVPKGSPNILNTASLYDLKDIDAPIRTLPGVTHLDIDHVFDEPVVISEYRLHWMAEHLDQIPDSWSLDLQVDIDGERHHVVADSVHAYTKTITPGVEVIYHKRFKKPCKIYAMSLHLRTDRPEGICLSQFIPYIDRDFYSIPQNTMYNLDVPQARIYVGTAWYLKSDLRDVGDRGYVVDNSYLGVTCTVPINDLEVTEAMATYVVTNPYHSKEVSCLIRPIVGQNEVLHTAPMAMITSIDEETITVSAYTANRFVMDISRNW